jgi:hypothetical protein
VAISRTIADIGSGVDPGSATFQVTDEYGLVQPSGPIDVNDDGSHHVQVGLTASREGSDRDGRTYSVTVSPNDKAGNRGGGTTDVRVPHDRGH